jgi:hypothetical protein
MTAPKVIVLEEMKGITCRVQAVRLLPRPDSGRTKDRSGRRECRRGWFQVELEGRTGDEWVPRGTDWAIKLDLEVDQSEDDP